MKASGERAQVNPDPLDGDKCLDKSTCRTQIQKIKLTVEGTLSAMN